MDDELVTLKERVKTGNEKLWRAWRELRDIGRRTKPPEAIWGRWEDAQKKLDALCTELKLKGFNDCLYINPEGVKTLKCLCNPEQHQWWCIVCPSDKKYWEDELMGYSKEPPKGATSAVYK